MSTTVVGIDLGTTNSLAATLKAGRPVVLRNDDGNGLIPSVIHIDAQGQVIVGQAAKDFAVTHPQDTLFSVKRLMGRTLAELSQSTPNLPQQLLEETDPTGRKVLRVRFGKRSYTPEQLSAYILMEVKKRAGNPKKAVITVPAYFDDSQRQATRDAARIAGLEVLRIINEPTAAALAYGLDQKKQGKIVVYDLGGGTFDCSILQLVDGIFKVLSTHGNTQLGGDDFDRALIQIFTERLRLPIETTTPELMQYLRKMAEQIKHQLTDVLVVEAHFKLPSYGLDHTIVVTRDEFELRISQWIDQTIASCKSALKDAELTKDDITEVVLVGGSTRVPAVKRRVAEFFGKQPHCELNPDEVVALGAAIQASILSGENKNLLLLDVIPLSLGIETLGGVVDKVIHRNSTVPARATTRYTTFVDNQTAINLNIYQGERELAKDCRLLGMYKLSGIPAMPAQLAQVDVTFLVDANGILTVHAQENRSGQKMTVQIQPSHGLTPDEVESLVLESIQNAKEDFQTRRFIELKNKADTDIRHTDKALKQLQEQLDSELIKKIEQAKLSLLAAMNSNQVDGLQTALNQFGQTTLPLAEQMMNFVVQATLTGKNEIELDEKILN